MNIPTAIEILGKAKEHDFPHSVKGYKDAAQLGIEALKAIEAWRNDNDGDLLWDFPGETE